MDYKTKQIKELVDIIELTSEEYQRTNDIYKEALLKDGVHAKIVKHRNLKKVILTDGIYRKEFILQINEDSGKNREQEFKERRKYIEEIEKDDPVPENVDVQIDIDKLYAE